MQIRKSMLQMGSLVPVGAKLDDTFQLTHSDFDTVLKHDERYNNYAGRIIVTNELYLKRRLRPFTPFVNLHGKGIEVAMHTRALGAIKTRPNEVMGTTYAASNFGLQTAIDLQTCLDLHDQLATRGITYQFAQSDLDEPGNVLLGDNKKMRTWFVTEIDKKEYPGIERLTGLGYVGALVRVPKSKPLSETKTQLAVLTATGIIYRLDNALDSKALDLVPVAAMIF